MNSITMGSTNILSHSQSIPWSGAKRIDLFWASGKHHSTSLHLNKQKNEVFNKILGRS